MPCAVEVSGVASVDLASQGVLPVARVASRPWLYIYSVLTAHPDINAVRRCDFRRGQRGFGCSDRLPPTLFLRGACLASIVVAISFSLAGSVARVASRPWLYINAVLTAHPDINAVRR